MTEGVYSLFEVRPDSTGKLQRRRRARFHIHDAEVTHLEDLDDELSGVPEGPLTPESATAIRKLSGPHRQLVRWTPEYGDDPGHLPEFTPPKPFVPSESGPTSRPPVFEYLREGMDHPHTVEVRGDGVVLNGLALSPQESMKLLDNVRSGVGTIRYKRVGESLAKAGSHVWPIQNQAGEGPYRSEAFEPQDLEGEISEQKPHPAAEFENWKDIQDQGGVFGFERPEHAMAWFGHDALHTLKVNGFPLVKVPAERMWRAKSGRQVAFIPMIKKNESESQLREDVPEPPKLDRDATVPAAGNLEALASKEPTGILAFVEVNDLWRHLQAGWTETDEALRELGEVLRSSGGDPYRISDDLFLVFYPDSETMMTGLREASEPERVLRPAGLDPLTLAIGAGRDQEEAWEELQTARRLARQEPGHPQSLVRVAQDLMKTAPDSATLSKMNHSYVYHVTPKVNLASISQGGLQPRDDYMDSAESGADGPLIFVEPDEKEAAIYHEPGRTAMLRLKVGGYGTTPDGESVLEDVVHPDNIEVKHKVSGQPASWIPLRQLHPQEP